MLETLKKEKPKNKRFQTPRQKSENEKEFGILKPELKEYVSIKRYSKKYKQFQNME